MFKRSDRGVQYLKFNNSDPVALIVGVASFFGYKLTGEMVGQKVNVIGEDVYNKEKMTYINRLFSLSQERIKLLDAQKIRRENINIERLDYVFLILPKINSALSSREFLLFSKNVDDILSLATAYKSKVILISDLNQIKADDALNYITKLAREYHDDKGLDIRLLKLAEVYGLGMEEEKSSNNDLNRLLYKAINEKKIEEDGTGSEFKYYIHISDAISATLTALFTENTSGGIFSASGGNAVSLMSVAYMMGALCNKEVVFSSVTTGAQLEDRMKSIPYPVPGWSPKITFENGVESIYKTLTSKGIIPKEDMNLIKHDTNIPVVPEVVKDNSVDESSAIPLPAPFAQEVNLPGKEQDDVKDANEGNPKVEKTENKDNNVREQNGEQIVFDKSENTIRFSSAFNDYSKQASFEDLKSKYLDEEDKKEDKHGFFLNKFLRKHKILILILIILIILYIIFFGPFLGSIINSLEYKKNVSSLQNSILNDSPSKTEAGDVYYQSSQEASNIQNIKFWLNIFGNHNIVSDNSLAYVQSLSKSVMEYYNGNYDSADIYAQIAGATHMDGIVNEESVISQLSSVADGSYIVVVGSSLNNTNIYKATVENNSVNVLQEPSGIKTLVINDLKANPDFSLSAVNIGNDLKNSKNSIPDGIFWVTEDTQLKSAGLANILKQGYDIYNANQLKYYIYNNNKLVSVS